MEKKKVRPLTLKLLPNLPLHHLIGENLVRCPPLNQSLWPEECHTLSKVWIPRLFLRQGGKIIQTNQAQTATGGGVNFPKPQGCMDPKKLPEQIRGPPETGERKWMLGKHLQSSFCTKL